MLTWLVNALRALRGYETLIGCDGQSNSRGENLHPRCHNCASRPCPVRPPGAKCGAMLSADSIGYPR